MVTIYFSGTGNTKFLAKKFCDMAGGKCYSIEENVNFEKIISENDTIALCFPIHFSKAPVLFMDFVSKHKEIFKGKKIVSLCSQQFYSGDGARSIIDLLEDVEVVYAEHFNMQNNITSMPIYYKLTKRNNKRCLDAVDRKVKKVVKDIEKGNVQLRGFSKVSMAMGKGQHINPERLKEKQQNAVRVRESCVMCNKCVKCCPTRNLVNNGAAISSKDKCTFCMRCVNICPKKSISVLLHGEVREQYFLD